MKWSSEAEAAVKKIPFFVRKKVRMRVESEATAAGRSNVSLADVKAAQARYLKKMSAEIKGYQVDTCFGSGGCPNPANSCDRLLQKIEAFLEKEDLLKFLKQHVPGDLKFHHEFRITLAACPNACSQPQIKDVGIIGAVVPTVTKEKCTCCEACVEACKEKCIAVDTTAKRPDIDSECCVKCGQCVRDCPTGTIGTGRKGFRVLLGGKLGRHPKLAVELEGLYSEEEVFEIVRRCVKFYKENSKHGERFAEVFRNTDFLESLA